MLSEFLVTNAFGFMLIFSRVGAVVMMLPGIADAYVFAQARLVLALGLTAVIYPLVQPDTPPMPASVIDLFLVLASEVFIGFFIGTVARTLLMALENAGSFMSQQMGFSNAAMLNPTLSTQGSLVGVALTTLGVLLIFLTDMHHMMIRAIGESYRLFPVGREVLVGDFADTVTHVISQSFLIGVQMSAPFLMMGLLFSTGMGLMARLMPQIQIFFIAMPVQIALGLAVLGITIPAGMFFWLQAFNNIFTDLFLAQ